MLGRAGSGLFVRVLKSAISMLLVGFDVRGGDGGALHSLQRASPPPPEMARRRRGRASRPRSSSWSSPLFVVGAECRLRLLNLGRYLGCERLIVEVILEARPVGGRG